MITKKTTAFTVRRSGVMPLRPLYDFSARRRNDICYDDDDDDGDKNNRNNNQYNISSVLLMGLKFSTAKTKH